ncbi:hypothetical protein GCM10009754_43430 [Amycolatopsis minnesotensis]|uniref:Uncharacterized protein n=1 Tax=Amycolatopsis minnesotensis TaxID=337894 RepID=A0ABN2RAT9_9PSEU
MVRSRICSIGLDSIGFDLIGFDSLGAPSESPTAPASMLPRQRSAGIGRGASSGAARTVFDAVHRDGRGERIRAPVDFPLPRLKAREHREIVVAEPVIACHDLIRAGSAAVPSRAVPTVRAARRTA